MSHGMDQYLANCLTREKVVQVSTDPLKADALLTDHLGAAFDASVKELYPEPKPEASRPRVMTSPRMQKSRQQTSPTNMN